MKTLALLVDKIDNSKELILFAAIFGRDINAKVQVLYVMDPKVYGAHSYLGASGSAVALYPSQLKDIANQAKEKFNGFMKELKAEHPGIPSVDFSSETGIASSIIKEKVERNEYDMVMIHGQTEQSSWMQNSAIMDVVRNTPCPVYIIQPDAKYQPFKRIVYATDYNEEDITTFKRLIELAKPFDPEILALHISNDYEFEKKLTNEGFARMLVEKTGYKKVSVKMISDEDEKDAIESLLNEAEKEKANLIVVLKENRNFFERLFKSSFTAKLIERTQLPILVFHPVK